ncbi:uncharacterized protein LOC144158497 [Haemaphysalis longicornis]
MPASAQDDDGYLRVAATQGCDTSAPTTGTFLVLLRTPTGRSSATDAQLMKILDNDGAERELVHHFPSWEVRHGITHAGTALQPEDTISSPGPSQLPGIKQAPPGFPSSGHCRDAG